MFVYDASGFGVGKEYLLTVHPYMINIKRMFNVLSFCHMNKNSSMHKSRIQCIDSIFQIMTAVAQPLCNTGR